MPKYITLGRYKLLIPKKVEKSLHCENQAAKSAIFFNNTIRRTITIFTARILSITNFPVGLLQIC